jgi:alanine racemase
MREYTERAWAEIDLGAIAHNIRESARIAGDGVRIMAVVKANAYGHGAVEVAKTAISSGADCLGVASVDEGAQLRQAGITSPIVLLGTILPEVAEAVVEQRIECMACTPEILYALDKAAHDLGVTARIHLKFDTGMGRLGALDDEAEDFVAIAAGLVHSRITGIATQISSADCDETFTKMQLERFTGIRNSYERTVGDLPISHAANSAATILYPESRFDMVRPGIMIYGIHPLSPIQQAVCPEHVDLKPAMSLRTRILQVKQMPAGSRISYGGRHILPNDAPIGTIAIGYADGYPRNLTGKAEALVAGARVPVLGAICMDLAMVDLSTVPQAEAGDVVTLLGRDGDEEITAWDLAEALETTVHEFPTRIGPRVPRVYTSTRVRTPARAHQEASVPARLPG